MTAETTVGSMGPRTSALRRVSRRYFAAESARLRLPSGA